MVGCGCSEDVAAWRARLESEGKLDCDQDAFGLESTLCRRLGGVLADREEEEDGEGERAGAEEAGLEVGVGCMDLERPCNKSCYTDLALGFWFWVIWDGSREL
jgi:hypothetical protein